MLSIRKKYILNKKKEKVAVQMDIKTFEKIERLMEDYVLAEKMKEGDPKDLLSVEEAKTYYRKLKNPNN